MAGERLDKILCYMGYGTRKEVKALVKEGSVKVNDLMVRDSSIHVNPEDDIIYVFGEKLEYRKYIYIMLNKPKGVISATLDNVDETVIDLLPDEYKIFNPAPVGRLDKDTEGLLLLTNDGELNHMLLSPKHHVAKKYYAEIDGVVTDEDVKKFSKGIELDDGYKTLPSKLNIIKSDKVSFVDIIIYEGKFHQIKRMFEAVNKSVLYLKRSEMGPLKLDEKLSTGEYRLLTDEEVESLKSTSKNK